MGSSVCDVNVVVPWSEGDVLCTTASIFVVPAVDLRLGWSLDSDAEPTNACPSGKGGKESQVVLVVHARLVIARIIQNPSINNPS